MVYNYCNENNLPGLLLCNDFGKAFDSLNWNVMHLKRLVLKMT